MWGTYYYIRPTLFGQTIFARGANINVSGNIWNSTFDNPILLRKVSIVSIILNITEIYVDINVAYIASASGIYIVHVSAKN